MALQNRVTPRGEIVATPERGLFMGNRGGQMHDSERRLTGRRWVSRAWITCLLAYKGWHEQIMQPGRYTQLFFLDEATALAAGHRPCALCRRADFKRFMLAFGQVQGWTEPTRVGPVDRILHAERLGAGGAKRTYRALPEALPDGTLVQLQGVPHLVATKRAHAWSAAGYGASSPLPAGTIEVLTPPSIVAVLRRGYGPVIHPSASTAF